jgi:hypothetical protein
MKSARKTIALAISALALLNGLSCPAATLLVWQESLDPTPPYATWATAAHVIQDAIDAGSAGDEVVVTNGVYATGGRLFYGFAGGKTTNRVSIEKPLHVRSVNGPHFTVIEGVRTNVNGVSCAYLTNGASLTGFTLTNGGALGWLDEGGGVWCESDDAVVTDCILVGNASSNDGGGAFGGTLRNCIIKNNVAADEGGGTWGSRLYNCLVIGNESEAGGGIAYSTAINCILFSNDASREDQAFQSDVSFSYKGNPHFVNNWGDYHLRPGSPCIDAGTNLSAIITNDLDGNPRPRDGNGDGVATFDIGPYEIKPPLLVWQDSPNPAPPFRTWATAAHTIQDAIDAAEPDSEVIVTNGVYATGGRISNSSGLYLTNRVLLTKPVTLRSVNGPDFTLIQGYKGPNAPGGMGGFGSPIRCVYLTNGSTLVGFTLTNGATYPYELGQPDLAGKAGGGAYCATGAAISNCVITANSAGIGGGIYGETDSLISHCIIARNNAGAGGGVAGGQVEFSLLQENGRSSSGGGAIFSTLRDCTLSSNIVDHAGYGGGAHRCTLERCLVTGNITYDDLDDEASGAGVSFSRLLNCVVSGNRGSNRSFGGGCYASSLTNCTVVGNYSGFAGGILSGVAVNCIVYGNEGGYKNYDPGLVSFQHTCTFPMPTNGFGNITNAPMFVNALAGDYHLRTGSPCIDAGIDLSEIIATDLESNFRPIDGNRDGLAGFDMGAYEFTPLFFTSITRTENNVRLCWCDSPSGTKLQAAPVLTNPIWTDVPFAPDSNCVDLPLHSSNAFFRLIKE